MTRPRPGRLAKAGIAGASALASTPALAQSVLASILTPLGALVGLIAGIAAVLVAVRAAPLAKTLLAIAAGALGAIGGAFFGAWLGYDVDFLRYRDSAFGRSLRHQAAMQALPLHAAACAGDERAVAGALAEPLGADGKRYLGAIAWNCRGQGGADPAARMRIFLALMRSVHALYADGQRLNDRRDGYDASGPYTFDSCHVLDELAGTLDLERLNALRLAGLPLRCAGGDSVPTLDRLFTRLNDPALPRATVDVLATLIGGHDGLMAQAMSRDGASFLDRAAAYRDAHLVEIALGTGADALHAGPRGQRPALVWAERRFGECPNCEYRTQTSLGSATELAAVERLMPVPGPTELDAFDDIRIEPPFLHGIHRFRGAPDGGAAMLRFAAEHGADLGIAFRGHGAEGGSFLAAHAAKDMKPPLLDALEGLSQTQLLRLAHPHYPANGKPATPLLESARRTGNAPLVALLCRRGVAECTEAERAAAARPQPR